jgi:hypothetical protein
MNPTCVKCHRPMVRKRWRGPLPTGMTRTGARGKCGSCYRVKTRVFGTLPPGRPRKGDDYADFAAVERLLLGHPVGTVNVATIREVVVIGTRRGWSIREIAKLVGCADRTVSMHRAAARLDGQLAA